MTETHSWWDFFSCNTKKMILCVSFFIDRIKMTRVRLVESSKRYHSFFFALTVILSENRIRINLTGIYRDSDLYILKSPNLRPYVDIYNHALSFRIFEIDIKIILRSKIQFLTCISSWIIEKYCSGMSFHAMLLSLSCNWMNPNSANYIGK